MAPKKTPRELRAEQKKKERKGYAARFSRNLKDIRESRQLSQEETASRAGVSLSAYTSWEQGKRIPGTEFLWNICRALGVKLDEIVVKPD